MSITHNSEVEVWTGTNILQEADTSSFRGKNLKDEGFRFLQNSGTSLPKSMETSLKTIILTIIRHKQYQA
jgi:hypothetical protein